jgi:hypothetical protein
MHKLVTVVLLNMMFALLCSADSKIIAVVDDDIITSGELEKRAEVLIALSDIDIQNHDISQIKSEALFALVNEKIFTQEAKKWGINITHEEVKQAIERLEQSRNLPKGAFLQQIVLKGVEHESIFEQVRNSLIWEKLLVEYIAPRIEVTEAELFEFLDSYHANKVDVNAHIVSADGNNAQDSIKKLWDKSKSCEAFQNMKANIPKDFKQTTVNATLQDIDDKSVKKAIIYTQEGSKSYLFNYNNKISFLVMCGKKYHISDSESDSIKHGIKMKKLNSQAEYYMQNLKKKKFIEIYDSQ